MRLSIRKLVGPGYRRTPWRLVGSNRVRAFRPSYLTCANPFGPFGPPTRPAQIRSGLSALQPDLRKSARAFRPSYLTRANPFGPSGPPARPAQTRSGLPALLPDLL